MASKQEVSVLIPESVVEGCPEDEHAVLAEVVRSFNEENFKEIRCLRNELRVMIIKCIHNFLSQKSFIFIRFSGSKYEEV